MLGSHRQVDLDAGVLGYELDEGRPPPRRGEIDLSALIGDHRRAKKLLGRACHDVLEDQHHVGVVAIGLVELEHRELRVVARRQPLVAEGSPDLEHPLDPADDAPLQVELGRDAEVHVGVKCVVVRDERLRRGTAGDRVQHRRLDLDEAGGTEPATDRSDHLGTQQEYVAHPFVGPQVELALAVADIGVGDTVPLVTEAATSLREQFPGSHLHRELTSSRTDDLAAHTDPVPERKSAELIEIGREGRKREQLDAPCPVP